MYIKCTELDSEVFWFNIYKFILPCSDFIFVGEYIIIILLFICIIKSELK